MEIGIAGVVFVVSYLLGSISFGRVVARRLDPDVDLDHVEMPIEGVDEAYQLESIGGNTVSMKFGGRVGCLVGWLDIFKAFIPTLAVRLIYPDQPYVFVAAIAALIGHNWPISYRFKGGRGISPFYGGLFVIDPIGAVVVAFSSMLIGMVILEELLFAYTGGVFLLLPWMLITKFSEPVYIVYAVIVNVLFIIALIPEIRQIRDLRKKYGKQDMAADMQEFPMGRSMLKMMEKFRLRKTTVVSDEE